MNDQHPSPAGEQTLLENPFGTITSKRVIYYRAKSWFSGGSREDIPLQHVTSVRMDIWRHAVLGIVFLVLGIVFLNSNLGPLMIAGFVLLVNAILLIWGSPAVIVNTAGRDLKAAKGFPWQRDEAGAFVEALRGQLFKA